MTSPVPTSDGSTRRPSSSGLASIGLVLVVVLGVWLLNGRDPGTSTGVPIEPTVSASNVGTSESTPPPSAAPSATATATATATAPTTRFDDFSGLRLIALEDLPQEARDVIDLIFTGGPFTSDKDGSTFANDGGLLPDEPGGYYAEYAVDTSGVTSGSDDRGARRIIAGDGGDFYWTDDRYASFARVLT